MIHNDFDCFNLDQNYLTKMMKNQNLLIDFCAFIFKEGNYSHEFAKMIFGQKFFFLNLVLLF